MSGPKPQQTLAMSGAVDLSAIKARAEAVARRDTRDTPDARPDAPPVGGGNDWVLDVTEHSFQADVVDRSRRVPVLVDLWASWCGPCKQLSPVLERLARAGGGAWVLAKVDVDANPRIAQLFAVQSIPTVIAIAEGQPVDAFAGAQPEPQIKEWISALLDALRERLPGIRAAEAAQAGEAGGQDAETEDPRFTAAAAAVEAGDFEAAEEAYRRIVNVEPANEKAKLALAQVRFLMRAESVEPSAVDKADAAPEDIAAQIAAADAELAAGTPERAFERLVAAVRRLRGEDGDRARARLVELFKLFPPDDPRVTSARRALARALF